MRRKREEAWGDVVYATYSDELAQICSDHAREVDAHLLLLGPFVDRVKRSLDALVFLLAVCHHLAPSATHKPACAQQCTRRFGA